MVSRATINIASDDRELPLAAEGVPLEQALQSWLAELRLSNRSQTTIDWYRDLFAGRILPGLKRQGVQTVDQIRREHVRELREQLLREGRRPRYRFGKRVSEGHVPLTPASLHAYHRVLRAFYRWSVSEGFSADRGVSSIKAPKEPSREPRVFTVGEVESLLQAASPRDRLIVVLLLETGLRVSELCALQVADFRLDNPDGPYLDVRSGKGRKQRAIPLTTGLTRKLRQYLTHGRPSTRTPSLFVTERSRRGEDHRPLNRNAVEVLIRRLGRRAGIKGSRLSPHSFRHTFATRAVSAGMDPIRLQRVLGHTTLTMVSRYVHFGKSDLLRGWDRYFEG